MYFSHHYIYFMYGFHVLCISTGFLISDRLLTVLTHYTVNVCKPEPKRPGGPGQRGSTPIHSFLQINSN